MRRLSWKLWTALLLVVLLSVGLMALLTGVAANLEFQQYISQGNTAYVNNLAKNLWDYYESQGNWSGIQSVVVSALRSDSERIILADAAGKIVADTDSQLVGKTAGSSGLEDGTAVKSGSATVGALWVLTSGETVNSPGARKGYMGGANSASAATTTIIANPEEVYISNVNRATIIAGVISVVFALLLGWVLTRQITRPVLALNYGARQIAQGELKHRVKIQSKDEIGDLAASFNAMASNLENSEQSRRRMIADIAHELKTPLTVIDGTVDAIIDGVFQPDKDRLDSIKEQTQMLTRLVSDLRDLSLADAGQLKLDFKPTDLKELISRKITQLSVKAQAKNIRMELTPSPPLPEVMADPARIDQVITNLITNAIRHTGTGGSITLTLAADSDPANVLITVKDTGEGIAPVHLPHIFERFYRAAPSRSRQEGGAGLGLAIVKQMVEAHRGTVRVESQPGKGATFIIRLPVKP